MLPTGKEDARAAYDALANLRQDILRASMAMKVSAQASALTGNMLVGYHNQLMSFAARLAQIEAVSGLQDHVTARGEAIADVLASIAAVKAAGAAVVSGIRNGMAGDGTNYANWRIVGGRFEQITYTSAQSAALVGLIDDLITALG